MAEVEVDLAVMGKMQAEEEAEAQEAPVLLERPHQGLAETLLFKV